ncbi:hypothetical protein [Pedobacter paludis]|uniref:DUF2116 family Zn-ribbon domain-containing protein n=1 Tax=Pedobacter paludis TaxID=2203212 RepID=A0A317EV02_9SPHI|nr:hypothetical protein [Pedobacter paludis]PWS30262.1 hypothetical protein DF947_17660 [Pedobacter paludis]
MNPDIAQTRKTCDYCGRVLHGRSDQRFCNDSCRNNFNRRKRAAEKIEEHENTPEIFRIIKKNYELLKKVYRRPMEADVSGTMKTEEFLLMGVNPRFCTSSFTDSQGMTWFCMFEICICVGETFTFVKDFPDQAKI